MGLDLQKACGLLIMPLGLVWLLLFGLILWSRRLRRPGFTGALALAWLLFTLSANPWVGRALIGRLEHQTRPPLLTPDAPLDAVFVLGGGSNADAQGHPHLGPHGDRIAEAARLWHAGLTRCLVASGTGTDGHGAPRSLGDETRIIWKGLGVPDSAIRVVTAPCTITREEIAAYAALRTSERWDRVGLLTSAYHLPRALSLARRANLPVVPIPSDLQSRPRRLRIQDAIPQEDGIRLTEAALWEMVGRRLGR